MKKGYLLLITSLMLCLCYFSCSKSDNDDSTLQKVDADYAEYIGTWSVIELSKKGETDFISTDIKAENMIEFGKTDIKIRITANEPNDKIFCEDCDFTNHAYFKVIDGKIYGYSKKDTNHILFQINNINTDTNVVTVTNELTKTTYRIIKRAD